jgi:hypothetical protein
VDLNKSTGNYAEKWAMNLQVSLPIYGKEPLIQPEVNLIPDPTNPIIPEKWNSSLQT